MSKFTPTPQEVALINQIFAQADTQKLGVITGEAAVKIFSGSKLSPTVLAEIWGLADEDNNGVLTRKGVGIAVRLLGHAQRGEKVSEALVTQPGPTPSIEGLPPVAAPSNMAASRAKSPVLGLPPLTPQDKTKFLKLFMGCHPVNGLLSGEKARDVFVKSKLPVDKLSQIWSLADTKNRGSLDATDFTVAMYLIQASMSGQLQTIPPILPSPLYEQAMNGVVPQATGDSGHISPSLTGSFPARPVQPQYTGQALSQLQPQTTGQTFSSMQPQMTGTMRAAPPPPPSRSAVPPASPSAFPFVQNQTTGAQWDVTPQEKANSDRIFDSLDALKRGYIEGDVAVPFMLQSKLPEDALAQVWDLSDLNNDGRLTREGFAVAMHLIQGKMAGKDIPTSIPPSLIPPSMRGSTPAAPAQPQIPEAMKDLLWDDSPPASATAQTYPPSVLQPQSTGTMSVLQPQSTGTMSIMTQRGPTPTMSPPPRVPSAAVADPFASGAFNVPHSAPAKDLLGDDEEPHAPAPPLQDQSAEIGNIKNQLSSTNRSLEAAKAERATLEQQLAEQAAMLSSLQTQLSSSKAAYDTETKLLSTLKDRFAAQSAEIQKTRQELISSESDLSATKVEKAEIEGALLRDREEVRDLQRKMTETGMSIETTKAELEKLRKEAKQQKGLLAIAKKQLATREAEKAKVDKEMEEAQAELQGITAEREAVEAELSKEEVPTASTNGHINLPVASPDLSFAAAQPLPTSPDVSPPVTKSNNPFERLAMNSSPRPESPFLPFAASSALPTPSTSTPAPVVPEVAPADISAPEADPFGFNEAFSVPQNKVEVETPELGTPKPSVPPPLSIGSPKSQDILSPAETDLFTTPPSTATGSQHTVSPKQVLEESHFPALDEVASDDLTSPTPTGPPTATPFSPQLNDVDHEDTDLTHELKEIEESDSDDSSSDEEEDNEPLATVKEKLTENPASKPNGTEAPAGTSAFDDSFGVPNGHKEDEHSVATTKTPDFSSMFDTTTVPKEASSSTAVPAMVDTPKAAETPKANGNALPTAGVNEFDQALGKLPSVESSAASSQFTGFGFDSAFDDNFDFAAASVAQPTQPAAEPGPAAPVAASAFPPAPTKGASFDDVFGTSGPSASAAPAAAPAPAISTFPAVAAPAAPSGPSLSFDDAFGSAPRGTSPHPATNLAASTASAQSNGTGFSFDDAFGGHDDALTLDSSFTSSLSQTTQGTGTSQLAYAPPPGAPPPGKAAFPSSSPASSPRGSSSTQPGGRRSSSPPRHASPPPRHSSPKPRPSTADSAKAAATRHNRLSIRLPFGRKKKQQHDAPPVPPLAQTQIVEDPTPAVEDDVEAVKTLCGMGFSRTQAVTALEEHSYDVQRALNSLLGTQ